MSGAQTVVGLLRSAWRRVVFFALAAAALAVAVSPALGIAYGVAAIGCAALVRYAGEPGPTPAA